jgi:hypothetical protein
MYNLQSKTFSLVPASILGGKNPVNTSYNGVVPAVFSAGKYRAEITALGYKKQTVDFSIGPGRNEIYPEILLEPQPFNLLNILSYYLGTIIDVFGQTTSYVNELSLSVRFFDLIAAGSLALFVATVIFSFSVRTHMRIRHMPVFFLYNLEDLLGMSGQRYVRGELVEEITNRPVSRAQVLLLDAKSNERLFETHTNRLGEFILRKPRAKVYKLVIEKHGYDSISVSDYLPNALTGKLKFIIQKHGAETELSPGKIIKEGIENLSGFLFEFLLLNSIVLEVIFIKTQGLAKTAPFVAITILTIIIWLFYAKRVVRRIFQRA